jgi:phage major head subunit gpT-like protein
MNTVDFSRRVSAKTIDADIDSFHGMGFIKNYIPVRSEATPEALKAGYEAMRRQTATRDRTLSCDQSRL